jgi:hypothetical protein
MNGICCQIKGKSTVTSVVLLCQIRFLYANIGLKLLNLLELTFVFRNVLVFCHFFLEKKVTKNSRLCRNPCFAGVEAPLLTHYSHFYIKVRYFEIHPFYSETSKYKTMEQQRRKKKICRRRYIKQRAIA